MSDAWTYYLVPIVNRGLDLANATEHQEFPEGEGSVVRVRSRLPRGSGRRIQKHMGAGVWQTVGNLYSYDGRVSW